jgi:hypothetical protein
MGSPPATLCLLQPGRPGAQLSAAPDQRSRTDHGPCPLPFDNAWPVNRGCRRPSRPGGRLEPSSAHEKLRTLPHSRHTRGYTAAGVRSNTHTLLHLLRRRQRQPVPVPDSTRQRTRREHRPAAGRPELPDRAPPVPFHAGPEPAPFPAADQGFCRQQGLPYCQASLAGSYAQALRHPHSVGRPPGPPAGPGPRRSDGPRRLTPEALHHDPSALEH